MANFFPLIKADRRQIPEDSKNSSGYNLKETINNSSVDLTKLFCGSEGTLGIVIEAKLKIGSASEREIEI